MALIQTQLTTPWTLLVNICLKKQTAAAALFTQDVSGEWWTPNVVYRTKMQNNFTYYTKTILDTT